MGGSRIGKDCVLGQNTFVGADVRIGHGVKIQNNVSLYDGVELDDYRVLRTVGGLHERDEPAERDRTEVRVPSNIGGAGRDARREQHDRLRRSRSGATRSWPPARS